MGIDLSDDGLGFLSISWQIVDRAVGIDADGCGDGKVGLIYRRWDGVYGISLGDLVDAGVDEIVGVDLEEGLVGLGPCLVAREFLVFVDHY